MILLTKQKVFPEMLDYKDKDAWKHSKVIEK